VFTISRVMSSLCLSNALPNHISGDTVPLILNLCIWWDGQLQVLAAVPQKQVAVNQCTRRYSLSSVLSTQFAHPSYI